MCLSLGIIKSCTHLHPAPSISTHLHPLPSTSNQLISTSTHRHPTHLSLHPALYNTLDVIKTKIYIFIFSTKMNTHFHKQDYNDDKIKNKKYT